MRISDWSSDVCSSDLLEKDGRRIGVEGKPPPEEGGRRIDRIAIDPEPGRAKFGLKAQRSGGPLRRCPDRGGDDRPDRTDLAPKDPIVHTPVLSSNADPATAPEPDRKSPRPNSSPHFPTRLTSFAWKKNK